MITSTKYRSVVRAIIAVACLQIGMGTSPAQEPAATVRAIPAPTTPLPPEGQSAGVTRFSFIAYGDTRSTVDATALQPDHSALVSTMLGTIKKLQTSDYPVRFVLQTGDGVTNGRIVNQWNVGFVDVVSRLTREANVPYYLIPGNHDVTTSLTVNTPLRNEGLKNFLAAMSELIPPDSSPRRLPGYPTYAFGYGNTFVVGIDSDISPDETQFKWVKSQLEGLNRTRFPNVVFFMHHGPFTSGPHGASPEPATLGIRSLYMPLFRTHHVNLVLGGHEHLYEHWVEHYRDASGVHRMDLVVTAGGGAPQYPYRGEPDTTAYIVAGSTQEIRLDHIAKPYAVAADNKFHFVVIRVNGSSFSTEVVGVDPSDNYQPYGPGKTVFDLRD